MSSLQVICLGEALVDRLGPLGGHQNMERSFKDCLGGAPANVACGLGRLGVDVAFIGCIGNDNMGDQLQNLFISRGINIDCLQRHSTIPTRIVLVNRDKSGERTFGGFVGSQNNIFADQSLNLEALEKKWSSLTSHSNWLVLGTILLAEERSREVVKWTCEQALRQDMQIALDLNWRPTFWDSSFTADSHPKKKHFSLIRPFLEKADLLKLSKEEAEMFFDSEDPVHISKSLPKSPSVIITDGSHPIYWFLGTFLGKTKISSSLEVIDTTGAGDAFMAGLMSQLTRYSLNPEDFSEAENMIKFAAACGALVCRGEGAIEPQPNSLEVEKFLLSPEG